MLRRDRQIQMQVHQMMDACIFALSFWLAYGLRSNPVVLEVFDLHEINPFKDFAWLLLLIIPAAPFVLEAQGFYLRPIFCSRRTTLWHLLKACSLIALGLVLAVFLLRTQIARGVIVWFGVVSLLLMFTKDELFRQLFKRNFARAPNKRRFLLVGTEDEISRMRAQMLSRANEGIEIPAVLNLNDTRVELLTDLLHEHSVNGVILSARHTYFEQMEAAIRACEREGVEAWLVADFVTTELSRTSFDNFFGKPVLVFRSAPEASWQSVAKSAVDLLGSVVLLFLSLPVFLVVPLLIKFTSPGPILFRQQRSGLNGRPFTMFKFRTMVTDAEQLKHELDALNEMSGPVFKITKDPRITSIGRVLRKFSLDRK